MRFPILPNLNGFVPPNGREVNGSTEGRGPRIPRRKRQFLNPRLPARATERIPAWFVLVVSFRHPIERLCHEFSNAIGIGDLAYGDERAQAVHRERPLLFNSVAALDVLLFSFLEQVDPCDHTNSHGHPHFLTHWRSGRSPR